MDHGFYWLYGEYLFEITEVGVTKLFREKQLLKISDLHPAKFAELKMAGWQISVTTNICHLQTELFDAAWVNTPKKNH